mmetsp:Transcript_10415/g.20670  ORF Transcript_10415/g.20670 Transcript_10415/m.20670 type:complete len:261 (+) Transcript_10415:1082-1864(+)
MEVSALVRYRASRADKVPSAGVGDAGMQRGAHVVGLGRAPHHLRGQRTRVLLQSRQAASVHVSRQRWRQESEGHHGRSSRKKRLPLSGVGGTRAHDPDAWTHRPSLAGEQSEVGVRKAESSHRVARRHLPPHGQPREPMAAVGSGVRPQKTPRQRGAGVRHVCSDAPWRPCRGSKITFSGLLLLQRCRGPHRLPERPHVRPAVHGYKAWLCSHCLRPSCGVSHRLNSPHAPRRSEGQCRKRRRWGTGFHATPDSRVSEKV